MSVTSRSFTQFILHGRLRAIGAALAITLIPVIGPTLSIIIVGMITLRQGALEGFWVLVAATLPCFFELPLMSSPEALWIVGIVAVSNCLTWALAVLLYRYDNWNLVLEVTALIGIMLITTAHVIKPDLEPWWEKQLNTHITQIFPDAGSGAVASTAKVGDKTPAVVEKNEASQEVREGDLEPEILSFISAVKPYVTGLLTAGLLFNVLLQLFVSRWWQLSLTDPKRLPRELHQIHLTSMAGLVFLVALILSYLKIVLAQDLLPVLYLTFGITGLSLVHYAAAKFKGLTWLCLIVFYIVLIGSWMAYKLPLVFQLVALAALLDVWFDWRGRLDKRFP